MSKARDEMMAGVDLNMTPMIDIVFQLIIFFMIVIDMSQKDLEALELPKSLKAIEDEAEEGRLYVNINRGGDYILRLQKLSLNELEVQLKLRVDAPMKDGSRTRDAQDLAVRPILIRADRASEFKHVQKIMYVCGKEGIKIWKVNLAAAQEAKDDEAAPAPK